MYPLPEGISLTSTPFGNSLARSSCLTVGSTIQGLPFYKVKAIHNMGSRLASKLFVF